MNQSARYPLNREEFERIKTFPAKWEIRYTKSSLAEQGFFCIDCSFWVVCFHCGLQINAQLDDKVALKDQHATKSPLCPMVTMRDSLNVPMSHKTIYKCEKDRLYSFYASNFTWPVDVQDLAKNGFYFDPAKKSSCCYHCKLQIGSWTVGDTAASEHRKYNPNCGFYTHAEGVENVALGEENTPQGRKIIESALAEVTSQLSLDVVVKENPKVPRYKETKDRLATYTTWPASMKQRPGELAAAGFFYTSRGDIVQCYQCGGGLKFWDKNDVPWERHAIAYPNCALVHVVKGGTFVREMVAEENNGNKKSSIVPVANPERDEEQESRIEIDGGGASSSANNEERELKESRLCKVCLSNELGIVFLPCAHMVTCPDCAPQLTTCPVCRASFNAYVRAFLPA